LIISRGGGAKPCSMDFTRHAYRRRAFLSSKHGHFHAYVGPVSGAGLISSHPHIFEATVLYCTNSSICHALSPRNSRNPLADLQHPTLPFPTMRNEAKSISHSHMCHAIRDEWLVRSGTARSLWLISELG
jgi:hypothetical protein